jgi:hypothetical protein
VEKGKESENVPNAIYVYSILSSLSVMRPGTLTSPKFSNGSGLYLYFLCVYWPWTRTPWIHNLFEQYEHWPEVLYWMTINMRIHFLDMWIEVANGELITTLYQKETNRNTFLLESSAHPSALKRGLPKSQFYRLRRVLFDRGLYW